MLAWSESRAGASGHPRVRQVVTDADAAASDFASWAAVTIGHPAAAPSLSRLAFDGDEPVGAVLCMDYPGEEEGWIGQIATKATHRHRGIGRALLQSAFAAFHADGRRLVGLSTNSQSGARRLYENYTAWAKDLGDAAEPNAGSGAAR